MPGKNLKLLSGKPLITWTIEAALQSGVAERVWVSTEDAAIATVARGAGAGVPFVRPARLASDTASSFEVVEHALEWLKNAGEEEPEFVLLLQPTSPLRQANDIVEAVRCQRQEGAPAVVGVCKVSHPPQWLQRLSPKGELTPWLDGAGKSRRQDNEELYQVNGAIYFIKTPVLRAAKTFLPAGARAYVMPAERSLDIDTPWDFHQAELMLNDRVGRHRALGAADASAALSSSSS